jgi:hypothetical protein
VRVYVNGRLVIDAWQDSSAERHDGTIDLDAGEHRIVVEYYEKLGQAVIQFGMEKSAPATATPTATATVTTAPPTATITATPTLTPEPATATPVETTTTAP